MERSFPVRGALGMQRRAFGPGGPGQPGRVLARARLAVVKHPAAAEVPDDERRQRMIRVSGVCDVSTSAPVSVSITVFEMK